MILTAGLTPAWQHVLVFDAFTPGAVNRAREVHWCASGKVLNAARGLHHLGGPAERIIRLCAARGCWGLGLGTLERNRSHGRRGRGASRLPTGSSESTGVRDAEREIPLFTNGVLGGTLSH